MMAVFCSLTGAVLLGIFKENNRPHSLVLFVKEAIFQHGIVKRPNAMAYMTANVGASHASRIQEPTGLPNASAVDLMKN